MECIKCGCTDGDCGQCLAVQGEPCHWVADGKCSRCFDEDGNERPPKELSRCAYCGGQIQLITTGGWGWFCTGCGIGAGLFRSEAECIDHANSRFNEGELIKLLQEIAAAFVDCGYVGYPEITEKDKMCLDGYEKQPSDIPSCEYEYVEQSCGIAGDDYSGHVIYPYKDIFIKVAFSC